MTLGIMQMKTNVLIGNIKSIRLAKKYISKEVDRIQYSNKKDMVEGMVLIITQVNYIWKRHLKYLIKFTVEGI